MIKYIDCLDPDQGLPSLKDKSIDLCLTDPPFNIKFRSVNRFKGKIDYADNNEDYINWCMSWFEELIRVCKGVLIFPGCKNLWNYPKPRDMIIHYKRNSQGGGSVYHMRKHDVILAYGKFNGKINWSVLDHYVNNGFLNRENYCHPCPGVIELYIELLNGFKPSSVLDPFMGSGTTAEACIRLGIPWIGYEKEIAYKVDIDKRIDRGKRSKQAGQKEIFDYAV